MADVLLETKLYAPRLRRSLVSRPRLRERLDRGITSKLTLVSAPAGFGKTTLLAEWLSAAPAAHSVAWLSLDEADNRAASFWAGVVRALQTVAPGIGAESLASLQAPQPAAVESVLATLLNELGAVANQVVLMLDDYHLVDAPDIQHGMAFLLDHLPSHVHLVIATRADPALPLGRLRGRGELVEVRAADLRFTLDEADAYLDGVMGLGLSARDVAVLEGRTEGWIAALQLAALSMQGRDDVAAFIAGFAGDDRYIVDYLVEEVLRRQPDHVRDFLLQTSILNRLTGPLCEAVTGQAGGKAMLEALDRGNLFLVPLDDRRRWYRYHHLFADMLRTHLVDEQSERVADLHKRASTWYGQNGEPSEAISHALAAGDFERAADLIEVAIPVMAQSRQEAVLRRWLGALPDGLVQARPGLSIGYAAVLSLYGEFEGVEAHLRHAERWLDIPAEDHNGPNRSTAAVDPAQVRNLRGSIALYRAAQALDVGDVVTTHRYAQQVLDFVAVDDHLLRGSAAGLMGLAFWASGDLEAGHDSYSECVAKLEKVGHTSDILGCFIALADIRIAQGRLSEALNTYERGLALAAGHASPALRGTADMHVGLSEILHERNDLEAAMRHLLVSDELGEDAGLPQNRYRWRVGMARLRQTRGEPDAAIELLDEAERVYVSDYFPNVRPIPALRARVAIAQGRLGEALGWARGQGLSADDELSYLREFEHITLARLLLARSGGEGGDRSMQEALRLLERILEAADAGHRVRSVIEVLLLQALARRAQGDIRAALAPLGRALALAEPEGFVRMFLDEGPSMASLLDAAARHGMEAEYARRLLAAVGRPGDRPPPRQDLLEPLSERELDVLRLLGTELNGPDIARELVVSVNTLRSHTKNIFAKLGVNNRRTAVRRAAELGLLARARDGKSPPIVDREA